MNKDAMVKLVLLSTAKTSALGAAVFSVATLMGLPVNDPWFDVFVAYVLARWTFISIVNGMPEPTSISSDWYIWAFRSFHSMAHIGTPYFSHKAVWKFLTGPQE